MAANVIMPALGMAQETGRLIRWLKAEGEPVQQGEPIMEIETDKATVEIEAAASGTLAHVTAREGEDIPVGQVIALILAPGEAVQLQPHRSTPSPNSGRGHQERYPSGAAMAALANPAVSTRPVAASPLAARIAAEHGIDLAQIKSDGGRVTKQDVLAYVQTQQAPAQSRDGQPVLASPKARRLAREQGVDLRKVAGSGPEGAVLAADLESTGTASAAVRSESAAPGVSAMWRIMAERLSQAWTTIPHFYLTREVDASRLISWREAASKRTAEKITYTDLLVKLVAAALCKHPRLYASWQEGTIRPGDGIHIGLAVAVEAGLTVPVIHHADRLTLAQITSRRQELVERANASRTKLEDLQGGTFTISNLGMYGVDAFSAIVNPPQAAILAVGRIADRVAPVGGQPAVRPMMVLTLSCDHRVVDGARGAQFLGALASLIEEPLSLIE